MFKEVSPKHVSTTGGQYVAYEDRRQLMSFSEVSDTDSNYTNNQERAEFYAAKQRSRQGNQNLTLPQGSNHSTNSGSDVDS